MANDKSLPDWAVVGAEVLLHNGGYHYRVTAGDKRTITRVTKSSAFLSDGSRFVVSGWDKDYLSEWGSGQIQWRSGRSIMPLSGSRAQNILLRARRAQDEADFDALMDAVLKARRNHDVEAELGAVRDLSHGAVVRVNQLEELVAERNEADRRRLAELDEHARLVRERREREAKDASENSSTRY
jgi:hypothetical protein